MASNRLNANLAWRSLGTNSTADEYQRSSANSRPSPPATYPFALALHHTESGLSCQGLTQTLLR